MKTYSTQRGGFPVFDTKHACGSHGFATSKAKHLKWVAITRKRNNNDLH